MHMHILNTTSCFISSHLTLKKNTPMVENKRNPGAHPTVTVIVRNFGNNSYFIWEYLFLCFARKHKQKKEMSWEARVKEREARATKTVQG